jgi:hypothetical protein
MTVAGPAATARHPPFDGQVPGKSINNIMIFVDINYFMSIAE